MTAINSQMYQCYTQADGAMSGFERPALLAAHSRAPEVSASSTADMKQARQSAAVKVGNAIVRRAHG